MVTSASGLQGGCGASYAFSTTGSIEGAIALGYNRLVSLSEQNIIDCSGLSTYTLWNFGHYLPCAFYKIKLMNLLTPLVPLGNNGCNGGNMYNSFMYIIDNEGIDTTSAYPYEGSVSLLLIYSYSPSHSAAFTGSFVDPSRQLPMHSHTHCSQTLTTSNALLPSGSMRGG